MAKTFSTQELEILAARTVAHYDDRTESFWEGTKDHDVTQNYEAFLSAMPKAQGLRILDFGCGPGRDLIYFKSYGHEPTGLDGSDKFCAMAREYSGCNVLNQNFIELKLATESFDGVFANASLFHVPRQELVRVLRELKAALVPQGILFSSNPRGNKEEWIGERYGNFLEFSEYEKFLESAGFEILNHYYRPPGLPCNEQFWLAVVARAKA